MNAIFIMLPELPLSYAFGQRLAANLTSVFFLRPIYATYVWFLICKEKNTQTQRKRKTF